MTEPLTAEAIAELRATNRDVDVVCLIATIDAKDAELATLRTRLEAYEEALREADDALSRLADADEHTRAGRALLTIRRALSGEQGPTKETQNGR